MDTATVSPSSQLLYILNHQLVSDELAASVHISTPVLDVVDHARLILEGEKEAQASEKAQSAIHRWNLRVTSLTGSKIAGAQATGFQLALQVAQQSEPLYLQNARTWFNAAFLIVSRKTPASLDSFSAASEFLLYSFDKARYLPEFAREVANAGAVRKFGENLLNYAGTEGCDMNTRIAAIDFLSELIIISASPLRPLSQHIQNLAVGLLCTWSSDESLLVASRSAARLLGSVYIIAGKAQAGQAWRKTVESICGSIHLLLTTLASTTIEEQGLVGNLAPLDMPPIPSTSGSHGPNGQAETLQASYNRLQALLDVLILMLATPTERPVPVPIAVLVKLCQRMLNLTIYSPLRARHDTALRTAQLALLPGLHTNACRLLAQTITSAGVHLASESTQLLTLLSFVEGSYPSGSPIRVTFFAVASLIIEHTPVHPDDVARPLAKIVQSILRDAASLIDPEEGRKTISTAENTKGPKQEGRKTKRARLFESDQVMSNRRRTSPAEAELIHHSLTSLHRIILHGAWLFPASLLNQTLRLLLAYGLSGQFFNAVPDFSPNALLSEGLSYCPAIRTSILHCLLATLQSIAKEAHGLLELALGVFNKGLASPALDEEGRRICAQAVGMFDNLLRPVVPPLVKSAALRQATRDLTGGSVLGKEADFLDQEDEPISAYAIDVETAAIEAVQPQTQQGLSSFSMAGLNRGTGPLAPSQPIPFQSAAAPSAKDVSFSSLGQASFNKASAQDVSSPINSTSNAVPAVETVVTEATSVIVQTTTPAAAKETSSSTKRTLEEDPEEDAGSEDITKQHEDEPRVWRGGGKQAELAAVKWDAEDSDTSDDDAPMPKIYMSDDDEEGGDDDEDEDEQKDAAR